MFQIGNGTVHYSTTQAFAQQEREKRDRVARKFVPPASCRSNRSDIKGSTITYKFLVRELAGG